MKSHWIEFPIAYDGSQLRPLWAYQEQGVLGDSIVAFKGPCNIPFEKMVDLEDVRAGSTILGQEMLHFILEIFDWNLKGAVALQRLIAASVGQIVSEMTSGRVNLTRSGDDLYWSDKKFSISIASVSAVSAQIHFAVNVTNEGTPVPTCCLKDFKIDPEVMARTCLARIAGEFKDVLEAAQKVKPL